jgi:Leucine-rich repeat (LRR) protein
VGLENVLPFDLKYNFCYRLSHLQYLSLDHNLLEEIPFELCAVTALEELHVAYNQLISLPLEIGYLSNLHKLYVQKNRIRELPEVNQLFYKGDFSCDILFRVLENVSNCESLMLLPMI